MYKEKYLKYKTKYLDLKSQLGGDPNIIQEGGVFGWTKKEQQEAADKKAEAEQKYEDELKNIDDQHATKEAAIEEGISAYKALANIDDEFKFSQKFAKAYKLINSKSHILYFYFILRTSLKELVIPSPLYFIYDNGKIYMSRNKDDVSSIYSGIYYHGTFSPKKYEMYFNMYIKNIETFFKIFIDLLNYIKNLKNNNNIDYKILENILSCIEFLFYRKISIDDIKEQFSNIDKEENISWDYSFHIDEKDYQDTQDIKTFLSEKLQFKFDSTIFTENSIENMIMVTKINNQVYERNKDVYEEYDAAKKEANKNRDDEMIKIKKKEVKCRDECNKDPLKYMGLSNKAISDIETGRNPYFYEQYKTKTKYLYSKSQLYDTPNTIQYGSGIFGLSKKEKEKEAKKASIEARINYLTKSNYVFTSAYNFIHSDSHILFFNFYLVKEYNVSKSKIERETFSLFPHLFIYHNGNIYMSRSNNDSGHFRITTRVEYSPKQYENYFKKYIIDIDNFFKIFIELLICIHLLNNSTNMLKNLPLILLYIQFIFNTKIDKDDIIKIYKYKKAYVDSSNHTSDENVKYKWSYQFYIDKKQMNITDKQQIKISDIQQFLNNNLNLNLNFDSNDFTKNFSENESSDNKITVTEKIAQINNDLVVRNVVIKDIENKLQVDKYRRLYEKCIESCKQENTTLDSSNLDKNKKTKVSVSSSSSSSRPHYQPNAARIIASVF
jgi:hypothetical protein